MHSLGILRMHELLSCLSEDRVKDMVKHKLGIRIGMTGGTQFVDQHGKASDVILIGIFLIDRGVIVPYIEQAPVSRSII